MTAQYRRVDSFAWRWEFEPQPQDHRWHPAFSVEDTVTAARASLAHLRRKTRRALEDVLERDVRVRDPRQLHVATEATRASPSKTREDPS